jgi:hypothetical protein
MAAPEREKGKTLRSARSPNRSRRALELAARKSCHDRKSRSGSRVRFDIADLGAGRRRGSNGRLPRGASRSGGGVPSFVNRDPVRWRAHRRLGMIASSHAGFRGNEEPPDLKRRAPGRGATCGWTLSALRDTPVEKGRGGIRPGQRSLGAPGRRQRGPGETGSFLPGRKDPHYRTVRWHRSSTCAAGPRTRPTGFAQGYLHRRIKPGRTFLRPGRHSRVGRRAAGPAWPWAPRRRFHGRRPDLAKGRRDW